MGVSCSRGSERGQLGSAGLPSPLQPTTVKVVGRRPCGLLRCMVLGPAATCEPSQPQPRRRNHLSTLKTDAEILWRPGTEPAFFLQQTLGHAKCCPPMKGHVLPSRAEEMGKHQVSVVQESPAALSLRHTVSKVGSEAAPVVSWLSLGLQVLWRDVNSVRAGRAVSQSHLNPARHSESLVPLVNGKLAPNFASLGKSP